MPVHACMHACPYKEFSGLQHRYLSAKLMVTWWCEVLLQARCGTILTDLVLALVKQLHARVSIIN